MAQSCPQCGAEMEFRLGVTECASCGHQELKAVKEEESPKTGASGPGFKSTWSTPSGQQGTYAVPPPTAVPGAGLYQPEEAPDLEKPRGLELEKRIWFGILVVTNLLSLIGVFILAGMGAFTGMGVFGQVFGTVLGIGLYWAVLFASPKWLKLTCMGFVSLVLVGFVIGYFSLSSELNDFLAYGSPLQGLVSSGILVGFLILQGGFILWLITILFREIMANDA